MAEKREYAKYIEHAVLKPWTTQATVKQFCEEAVEYGFAAVALAPTQVQYAAELLKGTDVAVGAAIGYPHGTTTTYVKVTETIEAIANGATEVDMVINIGAVKDGRWDFVEDDIRAVVEAAHQRGVIAKVILETSMLTDEEKVSVCKCCVAAQADYVKTCTGFGGGGATVEDIRLMKEAVGDKCKVKASYGVNDRETFEALLEAGATRFGTSKGIRIIKGE